MQPNTIIHTGFYTDHALEFFKCMKCALHNCWGSRQMARNADLMDIERNPDNEVVIKLGIDAKDWSYSWRMSTFSKMPIEKFNSWLAGVLKHLVLKDVEDKDKKEVWSRDNSAVARTFNGGYYLNNPGEYQFTVKEIYFVYETLLNRKRREKHWNDEFVKAMVGEQLDPIATELEVARREEMAKLQSNLKERLDALDKEMYNKIKQMTDKIHTEYYQLKKDATAETENKIKELEDMLTLNTLVA